MTELAVLCTCGHTFTLHDGSTGKCMVPSCPCEAPERMIDEEAMDLFERMLPLIASVARDEYARARGLNITFCVDEAVEIELETEGRPFRAYVLAKEREPKSWISPELSLRMFEYLESRLFAPNERSKR